MVSLRHSTQKIQANISPEITLKRELVKEIHQHYQSLHLFKYRQFSQGKKSTPQKIDHKIPAEGGFNWTTAHFQTCDLLVTFPLFNLRRHRKLKVNHPHKKQSQDVQKNTTIFCFSILLFTRLIKTYNSPFLLFSFSSFNTEDLCQCGKD